MGFANRFSFTQSISDKYLYKIIGEDRTNGETAWWIVKVKPEKFAIFTGLVNKGNLKLSEYGQILDSGYGNAIPPEILTKHGFAQ